MAIAGLRSFYRYRKGRFAARAGIIDDDHYEPQKLAYQRTLQRVIAREQIAALDERALVAIGLGGNDIERLRTLRTPR